MYAIVVVDDEVDVRKAIIDIIDWDKLGFRLAGQAGNGQEALALIEETSPDVILTDIKMPFMDGITLAKKVREVNPVTKIVFLTGFNDFDYAISAIKLNVLAYLLKPISAKNLTETLISIREKLDKEQSDIRNLEKLKEGYSRSLEIRKMSLLISLVADETDTVTDINGVDRLIQEYGLNLQGGAFLLFALSLDAESFKDATVPTDDIEILKFSLQNTVSAIAEKYLGCEAFIFGSVIIGILSDTEENMDSYADILIREIHQSIPLFYGFSVTIGVSEPYTVASKTKNAFRQAMTAIRYRASFGGGKVLYITDIESSKGFVPVFDEAKDARFCSVIKTGSQDEMAIIVADIFHQLETEKASPESYRICIIEMYAAALRSLKSIVGSMEVQVNLNFEDEVFSLAPEKQQQWLIALCHEMMEIIQKQQKTASGLIVEKGLDYLKKNYSDPDISLKSVSKELHISSSYFSSLFKKETGVSFTDALIKIRMEAARELILATRHKVFEVALMTGYADQHYFSYCFKKYFGQSPNEMRASHMETQPVKRIR